VSVAARLHLCSGLGRPDDGRHSESK